MRPASHKIPTPIHVTLHGLHDSNGNKKPPKMIPSSSPTTCPAQRNQLSTLPNGVRCACRPRPDRNSSPELLPLYRSEARKPAPSPAQFTCAITVKIVTLCKP